MCHYANDKGCADFVMEMHQKRLAEGFRPEVLEEFTAIPRSPSWI